MKFTDYSSPQSPSKAEQLDALRKGLGRAVQWATTGTLDEESLLHACLSDLRFDMQCEGPRSDWLWGMVRRLDAQSRFRVPILHAMYDLDSSDHAQQLCGLAFHFAKEGDDTFRSLLYEIVATRPLADIEYLGESELLQLDGLNAVSAIAEIRGKELRDRDWEWHDAHFIDEAIESFGEARVKQQLCGRDMAIEHFRQQLAANAPSKTNVQRVSRREQMRAVSLDEVLAKAREGRGHFALFRGWGMHADEGDLERVASRLWQTEDPSEIVSLLRVFSNRAMPRFDTRLISLTRHPEEDVSRWAWNSLGKNTNQEVRRFAVERLWQGDMRAIGLLIKNYARGDEESVLECMCFPEDSDRRHWMLMDIIKLLEENVPNANSEQLGIVVYAFTPCEICRKDAVRLLCQQKVAPSWLLEECRFDANEDTRELSN